MPTLASNAPYEVSVSAPGHATISNERTTAYFNNSTLAVSTEPFDFDGNAPADDRPLTQFFSESPFPDAGRRKHLARLTLNVTSTCNLRCTYCYAEYGLYGKKPTATRDEDFKEVVLSTLEYYRSIRQIQFFGGEPLLRMDRIQDTCDIIDKAVSLGVLAERPSYSVVTNGILLAHEEVRQFLKDNNFHVTVSIDGPRDITDQLRPQADGAGTYDAICSGIDLALADGIQVSFEATFTRLHLEQQYSVADILGHASDRFGVGAVHVAPVAYSQWGDYRPDCAAASRSFFEASRLTALRVYSGEPGLLSAAYNVLEKLGNRQRALGYCPAFTEQLSLDCNGNAYPCFMSMSNGSLNMGSIRDSSWPNPQSEKVFNDYRTAMCDGDFGARHKVWFDSLISGCAAADLLNLGHYGVDSDFEVHEATCAGALIGFVEAETGVSSLN